MNCLHSCFKNLVSEEGNLLLQHQQKIMGWRETGGMEPCWFWDCVQSVIYGENRDNINYYFGM